MKHVHSKPEMIVEPGVEGKTRNAYFLSYRGERLLVTGTEYVLLQGLLDDEGLDYEVAQKRRAALTNSSHAGHSGKVLDATNGRERLKRLRRKITGKFPDLVIPETKGRNAANPRLLTQDEIDAIHKRLARPGKSTHVDTDEFGRKHLFVNGKEIDPRGIGSIDRSHLLFASLWLFRGFGFFGNKLLPMDIGKAAFRKAWKQLAGAEISPGGFDAFRKNVRLAFTRVKVPLPAEPEP